MAYRLTGEVLDDQLHRVAKGLLDGEILDPIGLWPFLTLVQDINPKRYFMIEETRVGADQSLYVGPPPEGKVWRVVAGKAYILASAVAGNRVMRLTTGWLDKNDVEQTILGLGAQTIAATGYSLYHLNLAEPSGNPHNGDFIDSVVILDERTRLRWVCSAGGDAGDDSRLYVLIEETVNYKV